MLVALSHAVTALQLEMSKNDNGKREIEEEEEPSKRSSMKVKSATKPRSDKKRNPDDVAPTKNDNGKRETEEKVQEEEPSKRSSMKVKSATKSRSDKKRNPEDVAPTKNDTMEIPERNDRNYAASAENVSKSPTSEESSKPKRRFSFRNMFSGKSKSKPEKTGSVDQTAEPASGVPEGDSNAKSKKVAESKPSANPEAENGQSKLESNKKVKKGFSFTGFGNRKLKKSTSVTAVEETGVKKQSVKRSSSLLSKFRSRSQPSLATETAPVVRPSPVATEHRPAEPQPLASAGPVRHMPQHLVKAPSAASPNTRRPVEARAPFVPGLVGLINRKNSCYINVIIQCLSHLDQLTQYFVTNDYEPDFETISAKWSKEPRRDLTDRLATLLRSLWTHTYSEEQSQKFRSALAFYRPEFNSKTQQDAQEIFLFLLNTVHDELNVARKSLYRTKSQSATTSGLDVASSAAEYTRRNQSFIYRLFAGLQQSTLHCPGCRGHYRTVDPYLCLSLPIPSKETRPMFVTYVDLQCRETRHGFVVTTEDTVGRLRHMLGRRIHLDPASILLVEMTYQGFGRNYRDDELLSELLHLGEVALPPGRSNTWDGLFAVELPDVEAEDSDESDSKERDAKESGDEESKDEEKESKQKKKKEKKEKRDLIDLLIVHLEEVAIEEDENDDVGERKRKKKKKRRKEWQRFTGPAVIRLGKQASFEELEDAVVNQLSDALDRVIPRQETKLRFWVVDGLEEESELSASSNEQPLLTDTVSHALSWTTTLEGGSSIGHVRLATLWSRRQRTALVPSAEEVSWAEDMAFDDSVSRVARQFGASGMYAETPGSPGLGNVDVKHTVTLARCLEDYMKSDRLAEKDAWLCPKCRSRQRATVQMSLWTSPDVLAIHLKRFRRTGEEDKAVIKMDVLVDFPLEKLDVRPYLEQANGLAIHVDSLSGVGRTEEASVVDDYLYDLMAVCNHEGSMAEGHYTAVCRSTIDAKWRLFNDTKVTEVPASQVVSPLAYILLYQRRTSLASTTLAAAQASRGPVESHWSYTRLEFPFPIYMAHTAVDSPRSDPLTRKHGQTDALHGGSLPRSLSRKQGPPRVDSPDNGPVEGRVVIRRHREGSAHTPSYLRHSTPAMLGSSGHIQAYKAAANRHSYAPGELQQLSGPHPYVAVMRPKHKTTAPRVIHENGNVVVHTSYRSTVHVPTRGQEDELDAVCTEEHYIWRGGIKIPVPCNPRLHHKRRR